MVAWVCDFFRSGAARRPTTCSTTSAGQRIKQGELCRSLVFGGVPARFPNLAFGFLECGAGWGVDLLHSLEEHWEKRNVAGLANYDPARLDRPRLVALLKEWGGPEYIAASSERLRRAP